MSAAELVNKCYQSGVLLQWNGNKITAYGDERIITQLLPELRTHKEELKAYFTSEAMEFYHERAGIAEYDGGLSRTEAESMALAEVQARYIHTIH